MILPELKMAVAEFLSHLREYVHDDKHFTARWLKKGKIHFGLETDSEVIVQILGGLLILLLFRGDQAEFIANFFCTLVPMLTTYVFPDERPPANLLLIYWTTLSIVNLLDNVLYSVLPGYYIFKLCAMACMFLKPINGAHRILVILKKNNVYLVSDKETELEGNRLRFNNGDLSTIEKSKKKKPPSPEDLNKAKKIKSHPFIASIESSKSKENQLKKSSSEQEELQQIKVSLMSPLITVDPNFPSFSNPVLNTSKEKKYNSIMKSQKSPNVIKTTVFSQCRNTAPDLDESKPRASSTSTDNLSLSDYFEFLSESSSFHSQGESVKRIDEPCKKKTFSPRSASVHLSNTAKMCKDSSHVASDYMKFLSEDEEIYQDSEP